ncbi:nucleoside recognition protein [Halobaculum sp. CBA1158]|uniref:nucleoside recognition protein n=1 Tax=Halobaculum sp. CBA1158 TaxID=2904243 RepID=UPI001F39AFC1|nr:nucleoside recognition protein [Halobaculum sp. CBA1158]UIO99987.1 nucleoside recognition protein [Halobaculum sp. CBA1158]
MATPGVDALALAIADLLPLVADALVRVARIAVLVAVGVLLANVAVEFGLVERIAGFSRYLTGPANLPDEAGTAIVTTAASTTAGYGMLADFRESGRLSDRATLVAVTINTFFGFVQHLFTFYVPVVIPILGRETGVLYVATRGAIALGITLTGVLGGALLLRGEAADRADSDPDSLREATDGGTADDTDADGDRASDSPADGGTAGDADADATARERVAAAARSTWSTLRRILPRLAVVYVFVTVLVARVDLRALSGDVAGPFAEVFGLPAATIPAIAVFVFDTTAGAAAFAPLVGTTLTPEQAVAGMLIGGIVSFAFSTFKRSIPFQYGVWGPAFGSKVVLLNTTLKVAFIGAALVAFLA